MRSLATVAAVALLASASMFVHASPVPDLGPNKLQGSGYGTSADVKHAYAVQHHRVNVPVRSVDPALDMEFRGDKKEKQNKNGGELTKRENDTVVIRRDKEDTVVQSSEGDTIVIRRDKEGTVVQSSEDDTIVIRRDKEGTVVQSSEDDTIVIRRDKEDTVVQSSEGDTIVIRRDDKGTVVQSGEEALGKSTEHAGTVGKRSVTISSGTTELLNTDQLGSPGGVTLPTPSVRPISVTLSR